MTVTAPAADCRLCPRLVEFRESKSARAISRAFTTHRSQSFGPNWTRACLIVGLAPGLKGANQTGRPFTGDYAGDLLYATLLKFGFARRLLRRAMPKRWPTRCWIAG